MKTNVMLTPLVSNDTLSGMAGDDILIGGAGADTLNSGAGSDPPPPTKDCGGSGPDGAAAFGLYLSLNLQRAMTTVMFRQTSPIRRNDEHI